MAVMTKYLLDKMMDHVLRGLPYKPPQQVYLALFSTKIDADGKGSEIQAPGYERQPVVFGNKLFQGYLKNSAEVKFNVATEAWGDIAELALMEEKTGSKILFHGPVSVRKKIEKGDQAKINLGELVVKVDTAAV